MQKHIQLFLFITFTLFFTTVNATNFYWVGGTGNWNDPSHWALTSGGSPANALPGISDNIFIDQNSFSSASLRNEISISSAINIHNFTVQNAHDFKLFSDSRIDFTINGNWKTTSKFRNKITGTIYFSGSSSHKIESTSFFNADIIINSNGEYELFSDLDLQNKSLTVQKGYLIANSKTISARIIKIESVADTWMNVNGSFVETEETIDYSNSNGIHLYSDGQTVFLDRQFHFGQSQGGMKTVKNCGLGAGQTPFTITTTVTTNYNGEDVSCNGASDATVCVSIVGGVGPFNVIWTLGPTGLYGSGAECYSGIDAGTYSVVVVDQGQGSAPNFVPCNTNIIVNEPELITLFSNTITDPSCSGVCDGSSDPFIIGGVTPYTYAWSNTESTPIATALCVGQVDLTVTDLNSCVFDTSIFILTPTPVQPNVTTVDASCFGVCDGTATSIPSGGNGAPYSFDWSTGQVSAGPTADSVLNLCDGPYQLTVTDNNGCTGVQNFAITEPLQILVANTSQTNLICNGVCSGAITTTTTNGTPPYTYQWFDAVSGLPVIGQTAQNASSLCAGDYFVQVTDANGCQDVSPTVTLTQPPPITSTPTATDIVCFGQCNGILSVVSAGGTGTHTYIWFNAATGLSVGAGNPLGGMCAGNYFVQITDANGCIVNSIVVTIDEPPVLTLAVTTVDVLCNTLCTGSATAVVGGGTGTLDIEWFTIINVSLGTGASVNNLCSGNYYAEVTDDNNCTDTIQFNILEPQPLSMAVETSTDVVCNGNCDGTTTFDVSGGTAPYTYEWFNAVTDVSIGQFSVTATNLCPGSYYSIATDANGCTLQSNDLAITQPTVLTVTITSTNISCFGACDGTANLTIGGGTLPYTIVWEDNLGNPIPQTGDPISGLCPGTYHADITDGNGCTITSASVIITEPIALTGTVATTDVTCNNDCDGTAIVTPVGGFGPFTYVWSTSLNTTDTELNLCAGNYDVTITDFNGCTFGPINYTINEPLPFTFLFATTNVSCTGICDGTADVTLIAGETSPYTLNWSSAGSTTPEINLCDGNYTLTITDVNGCDTIHPFTITEPNVLTIAPTFADPTCTGLCNGTASVNPSGGTAPYSFAWVDVINGPMAPTTDTISNLCPGDYDVTVTDANGCTQTTSFTITDPSGMSATTTPSPAACGTVCDGQVDLTIVGGTAPFTIVWFDATTGTPIGQSSDPAINLCTGNYYAVPTDVNGCSVISDTAVVTQVIVVDGTLVVTDPSCFGACDGSIDLTPSGGTPPYTFDWFDQATLTSIGQTTEDAVGLCAGDYYVIVTESGGCSSPPLIENLTEPTQITVTVTGTDATCFGVCDGQITSTPLGGNGPYTFQWIDATTGLPIGQVTQNATGLCAGDYELIVTDNNGCSITSSIVTISEPPALTASLVTTDASCFTVCDGTAIYTIGGGTLPYTFTWSSSANTTFTENNLCDGNYTVSVVDGAGCPIAALPFTINEPTQLTGTASDGSVLCFGDCNGTVSVVENGGTAPYTYLWDDLGAQTTPVANGLCAGTYNVIITDANGCNSAPLSADITEPTAITLTTITSTDATCGGTCDGTATIIVSGGTGAFTYLWDDPLAQTTQTAVSLCAGTYNVIVTDANGCSLPPQSIIVNEPNTLTVSVTPTDETCFATCNGSALAVITGGTGIITQQWDDPTLQTTLTASALCGGTYTVDVTDANGCTASASGTVNSAVDITATTASSFAQCGICDGTATVTPSGGTGALSIQWDVAAASQITATATALCAGVYQVDITDANGCTATFSAAVSNPNGETLTISSTDASCFGNCDGTTTVTFVCGTPACSILWNDGGAQTTNTATGLCAGSYGVSVTNGAGCISAAVIDVNNPLDVQANATSTDAICFGDCNGTASSAATGGDGNYSYLWDDISSQTNPAALNLCAGTYTVIVTDGNGCTGTGSVIVTEPSLPLDVTSSSTDASCNAVCDGTGTAFPVGGTAPYTYQWDDPASQTTQQATGLCAGTYNVTVVDAAGCTFGPLTVTIIEPAAFSGNITNTTIDCFGNCNGTATLNLAGGTIPYSFLWDDALAQTTQTATNLCAGTYNVTATDVSGCVSAPFSVTLSEPTLLTLSIVGTDADCSGNCNGQAVATLGGGTLPYSLLWDDPASQTTSTASNLCAGIYTLDLTDANGCLLSNSVTINAPSAITSNSSFTDVTCFGLCDGTATIAPSGGTLPFTTLWSDGSNGNSLSNLCPGTYDVDITDANGCTTNQTMTIIEPLDLTATITSANATCGVCDGSASVSPIGGTAGYTYQWDAAAANATTQNVANLCAGVYSVDITDAVGCTASIGVGISDVNAESVVVNSTDASCFGICDGTATAVTACVDGPCSFEWFDGTGTATGILIDAATNLCADNYFVETTNNSGCITVTNSTINEPLEIEGFGIVTDAACGTLCDGSVALTPTGGNGTFTYLWTDPSAQTTQTATGLCGGNVDVAITSGGCTITETYFIGQPISLNATATIIDAQCNGDCNGSAALTVNDGTSPYTFLWDDAPTNQTTQTAINLCAGNYNGTVTDANGCSVIVPVTIADPVVLSATVATTDVDCFGNCNGTATATPLGGTAPISFQWNDALLQTTITATSLCAGNYTLVITDASLCATAPIAVTINDNALLTITVSSTDASCNTFCDGSITVTPVGGNGVYQFSIDNGATFQAANLFSNLCSGSYQVLVQDGNGCQGTLNVNINEPALLDGSVTTFDASCAVSNGGANAIPTGGTPNYTYIWLDATLNPLIPAQTTQGATNLAAGIYNVQVTDANGCITTLSGAVNNFNAPISTVLATTQPVCNGDCNGAIDMDITSGTPNYSFLWFAGGQTTEDLTNVCAGNYTIEVTDAAGCISFTDVTLNDATILDATFAVTDATCGLCDGAATITPTGGDGFYTVLWTNGQSGLSAANLCAGANGAQITDGLGCSANVNFAVNGTGGPTGETILSTDATCFGVCDGTADVTPIGGTAPYTFFWLHDGSTANTSANLCPGTYFCEITDANDCIRVSSVTINDGNQIIDSTVITPADCGVCNGALSIFITGGNGPFTFQWDAAAGNATTQVVTNLCEGIYTVTVSDGNGCSALFVYSVIGKNSPQIDATVTDANCNGTCDGTATVNIVGGVGPFTDAWFDATGTNLGLIGTSVSNLCQGDYFVQIVDQSTGCLSATNFTIDEPDTLQFSLPFIVDNTCFASCDGLATAIAINGTLPYTYLWTDPAAQTTATASPLCAGTFDVTITDANNCSGTQTVTVIEPTQITMAFAIIDASCSTVADGSIDATIAGGAGGYLFSWTGPSAFTANTEDITNLFTGMYYLTTTDANGCSQTDSAFVDATLIVLANAGNDTTICGNLSTYTVNGNGGITYEWYDLSGTLLASTQSITFTPVPGTTSLVLVAIDGLCTDRDTINITINSIPIADAGPDVEIIQGTSVVIGGAPTGPVGSTFSWTPTTYINDSTIANPTITPDSSGIYVVEVTDLNGCIGYDTMILDLYPDITFPNGFSPNGDGTNDVWVIDFIDQFPECVVEVYNRWGQLLFISVGYQIPWDGRYNDQEVPIGTYYYIINLNHPLFPDVYTGPLTILR